MDTVAQNNSTPVLWRGWHMVIIRRYGTAWLEQYYKAALPVSIILLALALAANTLAGIYATESASNSVTDIILSNIPVFDIDAPYVYGSIAFITIVLVLLLLHPRKIPFTFCALALFYIIRAIFVSVTHIGPYPEHAILEFESKLILMLWGGGDQFFSGHTGTPLLMALVFWADRRLRYFFLASTLFFATVVLLGKLHYTIDVLSAFFITYAIYRMALVLFPREHMLLSAPEQAAPAETSLIDAEIANAQAAREAM